MKKSIFFAAIAASALAPSGASFAGEAYQGGPKSGVARTTQSALAGQYRGSEAYAQAVKERKGRHVYQGGPWTNVPMATH
jgi:hypothetical protein